jgi:hypothetical protein
MYTLIERNARNGNPWSFNNLWVHRDSYSWSGKVFPDRSARRPIIEFIKDLELYNYGRNRKAAVDGVIQPGAWDTLPWDLDQWDLNPTIVSNDGLTDGQRILISTEYPNRPDLSHTIATVTSATDNNGQEIMVLLPEVDAEPGDVVSVKGSGLEYHYNGVIWQQAQLFGYQTAPLFNLYDLNFVGLGDAGEYPESTFAGNRIFGYAEGEIVDSILGRNVKYDTLGQFIFENDLSSRSTYTYANGTISGFAFYCHQGIDVDADAYANDWHLADLESRQTVNGDFFSVPSNLQANPENENIQFITRNEWFDHFDSVMFNQDGFEGETYSGNNWRDTARDLKAGTRILQHRSSLLKLMLLASDKNFDYMDAARFVEHEYARFRSRFTQQVVTSINNGMIDATQSASTWLMSVLDMLKVNKTADFPFALSRVGGGQNFIPPTPAAMGILPCTEPAIVGSFLQGHDGSRLPLFGERLSFEYDGTSAKTFNLNAEPTGPITVLVNGTETTNVTFNGRIVNVLATLSVADIVELVVNDPRDAALLALENLIYDAIPEKFRDENFPGVRLDAYRAGAFRNYQTGYSREEINTLLTPMFIRWSQINSLDFRANSTFDQGDPFTWNYGASTDYDGNLLPGNWRGIYRHFFDTDRPHTDPWEMLGFAFKPDWWDTEYGAAPYTRGNTSLWNDLKLGNIAAGPRAGIDPIYARPDLLSILPVDDLGNLIDPVAAQIVTTPPTYQQAKRNWKIGDGSPVEAMWRESPAYRFALAKLGYLIKPARWVESNWDTVNVSIINGQTIYAPTSSRPRNVDLVMHGDTDAAGARVTVDGIQQWLVEHLISKGQDSSILTAAVQSVSVRLGHRMGGFTSTDNLRVTADNFGLVPEEDITIALYNSPSTREEFYSGMLIEWTGRGWRVIGYDATNPNFYVILGEEAGPTSTISISDVPEVVIVDWKANVYYQTGTLIDYRDSIYECKRPHLSTAKFEATFWDARPDMLRPEAASVLNYLVASDDVIAVPYGTEFTTFQEIADVILGYERWLVSRGWVFEEQNEDAEVQDWSMSVKEFLSWAQTQWAPGNFIAMSPGAQKLKFKTEHGTIYPLEDSFNGVYGIVNRVGLPIDRRDTFVSRLDGEMTMTVRNNDLFGVRLHIGEIEHALIFTNETIFGDVIYKPLFDLRQPRMKIIGEIASNWQGRMDAPGFMMIDNQIKSNFDKSAEDIRTMFDIEQSGNKVLRDHARHVTAFEQRPYMENLMLSDTQQFEFYQGMVQQKGAPGVFDKLLRSQFINQSRNLRFLEEWAFKAGNYGAANASERVSFDLFQSNIRRNPQQIVFEDGTSSADIVRVNNTASANRFIHAPQSTTQVFPRRANLASAPDDLPTAGWVRRSEVQHALFDIDAFQAAYVSGQTFVADDKVWLYDTPARTFDVHRLVSCGTLRAVVDGDTARVFFETAHDLTSDDIGATVLINGETQGTDIGGLQTITAVGVESGISYIEIDMPVDTGTLYGAVEEDDPESFADLTPAEEGSVGPGILILRSLRFENLSAATASSWVSEGDYAYVNGSPWVVYRKVSDTLVIARRQARKMDSTQIVGSLIYDRDTKITKQQMMPEPLILDHLLVYDPVVGAIAGAAERELTFKVDYDPARYDNGDLWSSEQTGVLWWDMSRARFLQAETDVFNQSSTRDEAEIAHRVQNWGRIAPGSSVDVYEWTRSLVLPAQWTDGSVYGGEDARWVEQAEFDAKVSRMVPVYYFWVKDRAETVNYPGRKIDSTTVARMIESPTAANIPWFAPISPNRILVSGITGYLNDVSTVFQLEIKRRANDGVLHSEWTLLRANDERSLPPAPLWSKLIDSIAGVDVMNRLVPDPALHVSMRHGVGVRPRQSLFVGNGNVRTSVLAARESFVNMVNIILARTNITQDRSALVDALLEEQPIRKAFRWSSEENIGWQPVPTSPLEIDYTVSSIEERNKLLMSPTFRAAKRRVLVNATTTDTPFWTVWEYQPSLDNPATPNSVRITQANTLFKVADTYDLVVSSEAEMRSTAMASGTRILVQPTGGFWSLWKYTGTFDLIRIQDYRTSDFWSVIDWYATGYSKDSPPVIRYATFAERNLAENPSPRSKFVFIEDDGTGSWVWTAYVDGQWVVVAREKGTVAFGENFYSTTTLPPYDASYGLATVSNRDGTNELRIMADVVREYFTDEEVNELFFSMVHFAHSHLDQVSWAFKTSFLYIAGYNEEISQTPVQISDGTESLLAYIDEVKPYRVKTRDFARTLNPTLELVNTKVTDFDKPIYYDEEKQAYRTLKLTSAADLEIISTQEPWKSWYENYQKPYRLWKPLWDGTRQRLTDNDLSYNFDDDCSVRRFRATLVFNRTSGSFAFGGETLDGNDIDESLAMDLIINGDDSGTTVTGSGILDPNAYERPPELLRVQPRDMLSITIHTDEEDSIKCTAIRPLNALMTPVKIAGWETSEWDQNEWDNDRNFVELLPTVQPTAGQKQLDHDYRWKLLPVGQTHVAKTLYSIENAWEYLRFNDTKKALTASVIANNEVTIEQEGIYEPGFPMPEQDARGAVMIGNERVEYSGMDVDGTTITLSGLHRGTRWTRRGRESHLMSVTTGDEVSKVFRLEGATSIAGLTVVKIGTPYARESLMVGVDFDAVVDNDGVEITLTGDAPDDTYVVVMFQTIATDHAISTPVINAQSLIIAPLDKFITGENLPDAWFE